MFFCWDFYQKQIQLDTFWSHNGQNYTKLGTGKNYEYGKTEGIEIKVMCRQFFKTQWVSKIYSNFRSKLLQKIYKIKLEKNI